jgi:cytochrome c oxidase subunit 4
MAHKAEAMSESTLSHPAHGSHAAHPTLRTYYLVFAALMVLLAATVAMAEIDLGPLNVLVAAAIATAKALLILLFFMHVRYSEPLTWLVAGAGFFWLAILFVLTISDYISRGWLG